MLFLQLKQARRWVIAGDVHGDSAWHAHQGQRVVEYQQALQTVSDPLLGWTSVAGRQFYVRQFRNMKGAISVESLSAEASADYVQVCGRLLAKGHARTSGASMIAGYVGYGQKLIRRCAASPGTTPIRQSMTTSGCCTRSRAVGRPPSAGSLEAS